MHVPDASKSVTVTSSLLGKTDRKNGNTDAKFCLLRQQAKEELDDPYMSQANSIAPKRYKDHTGFFAVTCSGCKALMPKYDAENDNYSKILVHASADCLLQAFAEYLHCEICFDFWGYVEGETLNKTNSLKIECNGIRPAPRIPM